VKFAICRIAAFVRAAESHKPSPREQRGSLPLGGPNGLCGFSSRANGAAQAEAANSNSCMHCTAEVDRACPAHTFPAAGRHGGRASGDGAAAHGSEDVPTRAPSVRSPGLRAREKGHLSRAGSGCRLVGLLGELSPRPRADFVRDLRCKLHTKCSIGWWLMTGAGLF
jgi:hypothetical protein